MGNELVTLNRTLPIHNGTVSPTDGNSLINYFISVAVLAEMAVSNADSAPWIVDERLNKRRNSYELDKHLQNMLLFLDGKNGVSAKCIPCGRNNLYKTEVVLDNSIYVHFCRKFYKNAKYNHPYLMMNEDSLKFRFCCFEYTLSKDKTKVTDISILIPRLNKSDIKVELLINLMEMREFFTKHTIPIEKRLEALNWHKT